MRDSDEGLVLTTHGPASVAECKELLRLLNEFKAWCKVQDRHANESICMPVVELCGEAWSDEVKCNLPKGHKDNHRHEGVGHPLVEWSAAGFRIAPENSQQPSSPEVSRG
jgi:hypothetical protein